MPSSSGTVLAFDARRLGQARRLRQMLKSELAAAIGVTPGAVTQFEAGTTKPSTATLARVALTLGMPAEFFQAGRRAYVVGPDEAHFRALRATSKRERDAARTRIELLAELVEFLERYVALPAVDVPQGLEPDDSDEVAEELRDRWNLGRGPISDMVGVLERRGIIVARLPASTDRVDAFSCWIGAKPYVVLTSNKRSADRSRFDAAHELAHLLFHHDAVPGAKREEAEAQSFASAFLLPRESILAELPSRPDFARLIDLKVRWKVSVQALLRRGFDLGLYSDAAYRRAMTRLSAAGWRLREPGDVGRPEEPVVLRRAVEMIRKHSEEVHRALDERLAIGERNARELLAMVDADRSAEPGRDTLARKGAG
jgi:Zn-dependent peptidase ImmA (M78 family)/DNA-binding XRE family transcriptional regulator